MMHTYLIKVRSCWIMTAHMHDVSLSLSLSHMPFTCSAHSNYTLILFCTYLDVQAFNYEEALDELGLLNVQQNPARMSSRYSSNMARLNSFLGTTNSTMHESQNQARYRSNEMVSTLHPSRSASLMNTAQDGFIASPRMTDQSTGVCQLISRFPIQPHQLAGLDHSNDCSQS